MPKEQLEKSYRCESIGEFFEVADDEADDLLEDAIPDSVQAIQDGHEKGHEIETVLNEITSVATQEFAQCDPDDPEELLRENADGISRPQDTDARLPDGPELIELTREPDKNSKAARPMNSEFPRTLKQAVASKNMWSSLWGLAVFLRCGEDGMDSMFLKRAELVRARSRKLNWHQSLGVCFAICVHSIYVAMVAVAMTVLNFDIW